MTLADTPQFSVAPPSARHVIEQWPSSIPFDASLAMRQHPELREQRSAVLDLAYEEYCRRVEAGQNIDAEEFAARFDGVRYSLVHLLEVHGFLHNHAELFAAAADDGAAWPECGDDFLGFHLISELGRGVRSRVFLARQLALGGRAVVVKVCLGGRYEATTLAQLQHPHVTPVFSLETDADRGLTAICMPFLGRTTLFDLLEAAFASVPPPAVAIDLPGNASRDEPCQPLLPWASPRRKPRTYVDQIVDIAAQVAEALAFAHGQGICHGDVKPSNVLLASDGRALLFDFNVSFDQHQRHAGLGGTLPYMAPEQIDWLCGGEGRAVDGRADVFSLGVTVYELLTGRLPFGRIPQAISLPEFRATLRHLRQQAVPPIAQFNPHVDQRLAVVIGECLAFDPDGRPTAGDLAAAFRRWLDPRQRWQHWAWQQRRRLLALGLAATFATATACFALMPRGPSAALEAGANAFRQGEYRDAVAAFDEVLLKDEESLAARLGRGRARLRLGDVAQAQGDFAAILERRDDGPAYAALGYCHSLRSLPREAATAYDQAILHGTKSLSLWNNLGYAHFSLGDYVAALRCLQRAARLGAPPAIVWHNLAKTNLRLYSGAAEPQYLRDAESAAIQALATEPSNAEFRFDRAHVRLLASKVSPPGERQELVRQALEDCETALDLSLPPSRLDDLTADFPSFRQDERFQALRHRPQPAHPAPPVVPILDPLEGLADLDP